MKPIFQPMLARLRARSKSASPPGLVDPTAVIERALRDAGLMSEAPTTMADSIDGSIVEGTFRVLDEHAETELSDSTASADGRFEAALFAHGADSRSYKLFEPAGFAGQRLPLVVMLHGCTQDPDDFARGTRMNRLAQQTGAVVLYPAQAPRSNKARCWNWFQPGDQRRDAGEPALLAAMTHHIIARHAVDRRRVHVAGLSAGGAMAAILGREYPELYASIGVHSGLPPGAAHDVASAFAAMKSPLSLDLPAPKTPLLVFHGDRDATVHPQNGQNLLGTSGERTAASGRCGRDYTRTLIKDREGRVRGEHWLVKRRTKCHGAWPGKLKLGQQELPRLTLRTANLRINPVVPIQMSGDM